MVSRFRQMKNKELCAKAPLNQASILAQLF